MHGAFTELEPPPRGIPMVLENVTHRRILWTGQRWYDEAQFAHPAEPWPPDPFIYGPGPWYEVVSS